MIISLNSCSLVSRFLLLLAVFATVALLQASDAPPAPQNFCEGWQFHLGDVAGAEQPNLDDSSWRTLDIPHDWSIELPLDPNVGYGMTVGYLPGGIGWYR